MNFIFHVVAVAVPFHIQNHHHHRRLWISIFYLNFLSTRHWVESSTRTSNQFKFSLINYGVLVCRPHAFDSKDLVFHLNKYIFFLHCVVAGAEKCTPYKQYNNTCIHIAKFRCHFGVSFTGSRATKESLCAPSEFRSLLNYIRKRARLHTQRAVHSPHKDAYVNGFVRHWSAPDQHIRTQECLVLVLAMWARATDN